MSEHDSLHAINQRLHELIEEDLLLVFESLTALDWVELRAAWARFEGRLKAHMDVEEGHLFPVYGAFSEFERGGAPELFDADHRSILKVFAACQEALEALDGVTTDARREMVLRLAPFVRLRNVLEHHTLREEQMLYPRLDAALADDDRKALADYLLKADANSEYGSPSG